MIVECIVGSGLFYTVFFFISRVYSNLESSPKKCSLCGFSNDIANCSKVFRVEFRGVNEEGPGFLLYYFLVFAYYCLCFCVQYLRSVLLRFYFDVGSLGQ